MSSVRPKRKAGVAIDHVLAQVERVIERRRRSLEAEFGWTHLHAAVSIQPEVQRLSVDGEVALPRTIEQLRHDLQAALGPDWTLALNLRPLAGASWRHLGRAVVPVERQRPRTGTRGALTTELVATDGPVECLASADGATLVRGADGTVGWTRLPLGPTAAPPGARPIHFDVSQLQQCLRSFLGVPYRLGGATRLGIDCSALVQRCLRAASNRVIPRHSLDQLAAAGAAAGPFGEPGDVLYSWPRGGGPCHVGVIVNGPRRHRRTVIHASASKGRVVEEALDRFLSGADRIAHAEPAQFLDRGRWLAHA